MKERYRGYYSLTEAETAGLWQKATVVVDTNVLLSLYALTPRTRSTTENLLRSVQERVWLPHQVGLEFERNKTAARLGATRSHRQVVSDIAARVGQIASSVDQLKRFNVNLSVAEELTAFESAASVLTRAISAAKDVEFDQDVSNGDAVEQLVEELYPSTRIGPRFSEDELSRHRRLGAERYAAKVPPGFEDAKTKSGDRVYGDYFLWSQLLQFATAHERDVIFVTDDTKGDWCDTKGNFHQDLIDEFCATTGCLILMYTSATFLETAKLQLISVEETEEEIQDAARELEERSEAVHNFRQLLEGGQRKEASWPSGEVGLGSLGVNDYIANGLLSAGAAGMTIDPSIFLDSGTVGSLAAASVLSQQGWLPQGALAGAASSWLSSGLNGVGIGDALGIGAVNAFANASRFLDQAHVGSVAAAALALQEGNLTQGAVAAAASRLAAGLGAVDNDAVSSEQDEVSSDEDKVFRTRGNREAAPDSGMSADDSLEETPPGGERE